MTNFLEYRKFICEKSNETIVRLDHLSLNEGDVIGIMGENGAGKSTLLKALSLLEPPHQGEMIYKGKPVNIDNAPLHMRREWACVFQHDYRFVGSVYDNVEIGLKLRKMSKTERHKKVYSWLERFHIAHLATKKAHLLSGGEAQRMNLARAFVLEPRLLFLDEPFSALDFPTKMVLLEELQKILQDTKTTTFLISHDLIEVEHLASHLLYIHKGTAADQGKIERVFQSPSSHLLSFLTPWLKARQINSLKSFHS
ncbi:ATP-binding cassette domain-containing protein [Salipaludibacillus daqingensis]|uniref:ATP-binding cassette domain-containing protein n=1 Tax=Salipaludibacillus daqingensis TaxID=3041001 RepID=UPI0024751517|nr:ATP-binding cassette domain-containing protein [Salipaludibacillus daqingensis]